MYAVCQVSTITSSLGLHDYHILDAQASRRIPVLNMHILQNSKKFYVKNLRPGPLLIGKDDIHAQYMH